MIPASRPPVPRRLQRAFHATLILLIASAATPAVHADDAKAELSDEAFYQRAATCAAAMEVDQLAFVARTKAGTPGLRPDMVMLTQLGFTYVGTAYKRGLRNPRADQMLHAAEAEQKSWPAERHATTVAQCRVEAQALYDDASSVEQWFVTKRANARVDKFFAPGKASTASASSSTASAPASR